ncbi:TPA: hypothetical protein QHR63_005971 [Klebsiella michiganensis]|uniref:Uncharacterized protein n=1 Tax=Pigmentiphaga soli TaxID=1007095 RepID=A0ABP8HT99_9BURK|nr:MULTISPECIES: hypothetical protein [Enterobacteriaceae]MDL2737775.1 hypothetical protein [Salmonella enterica]HDS8144267.1 hypothetical protein [Klebsiella michiganensis]HDT5889354.1 hypothetical protein [Aeromonas dhakensis]QIP22821.1 hypothetical protein HA514_25060 [Enterobacter kobei]HDS8144541.1 hypothetical protein [Klebsiella michiganensis]
MATSNVTGGTRRELTKYRITFALSLAVLIGTGVVFWHAYRTHAGWLNAGDVAVRDAIMDGTIQPPADQEGAR